jgi:nucleotide-binding universal stress UspA family protein
MRPPKNILVPIDFSPVGALTADAAATLAPPGAKVWLVHVAAPDPDFVGFRTGPTYIREHRADVLRQEHKDLQAMAQRLKEGGTEAEALLVQGPTTDTIIELAGKLNADLIVVGSHGKGALYRALVGSVSEQVLRHAKVPVLVVPSPGRE